MCFFFFFFFLFCLFVCLFFGLLLLLFVCLFFVVVFFVCFFYNMTIICDIKRAFYGSVNFSSVLLLEYFTFPTHVISAGCFKYYR